MSFENGGRAGADEPAIRLHGTCVAVGGKAVVLRGPPGAGKSDLAFRLVAGPPPAGQPPARLVADDQVAVTREAGALVARCPANTAGLLEIRGVGIRRAPSVAQADLALLVDLVPADCIDRLPPEPLPTQPILGVSVPTARLAPFEASAPLKLRALLGAWAKD